MLKKIYDKWYKEISTLLEEELIPLEDLKKTHLQKIDDLDNQKQWVDWIYKYSDDISEKFENPASKLLKEIINHITFSLVL